jgi:hypothetical protein
MGRLTITPVNNFPSLACKGSVDNQPTHAPSTVYAEIKIKSQIYRYMISGVPYGYIKDLPALAPYLEDLLEVQRPFNPNTIADNDYGIPRQLTFFTPGQPPQSEIRLSSARALDDFFGRVAKSKKPSDIKALAINDKAQYYREGRGGLFFSGALESLQSTCLKIQPIHFQALTRLELYIAENSAKVIQGITNPLAKGCFPQLKTLDLELSSWCRATKHRKGDWIFTNDTERAALYSLYLNGLINAPTRSALEHLHLPFWCAKGTELGLAVLQQLYANLKTLTVDMVIPTAVSKGARLNWSSTFTTSTTLPNGYGYTTNTYTIDTESHSVEFRIPEPEEVADQPTLLTLLEEMKDVSQLECLEVYDWPIKKNIVAEYSILQTAIANGWLPKLNSIALRFKTGSTHEYLLETTIDRKTTTDTTNLVEAVIEAKVPLKKLQLIMPEKNGYQGWLEEMANGAFPELQQFHYRLPDRWFGEQDPAYHTRVEKALDTIHTAVRKGQLPKLKIFIVEGNQAVKMKLNKEAPALPKPIWTKVEEIEDLVQAQQAHSVITKSSFDLGRELTVDTSPIILHTLESSQVA